MSEIISVNDSNWDKYIEKTGQKDIHFSQDYLKIYEEHLNAKCQMFIYKDGEEYLLYPFFKRTISDKGDLYDVISPWYYGGPLISNGFNLSKVKDFLREFEKYCRENKIVSEFTIFHPYLENHKVLSKYVKIDQAGEVVYVDLTKDLDSILMSFSSSCRRNIRKNLKNDEIKIIIGSKDKQHLKKILKIISISDTHLKKYLGIYNSSMKEKKARDFVCFSYDFFKQLRDKLKDKFTLIYLEYKKKVVASWIFLHKYDIMYYYLGSRDSNLDTVKSANRILYEGINYGIQLGLKTMDLGGGNESLMEYKKSFSPLTKPKYVFKHIYDMDLYKKLCLEKGMKGNDIKGVKADFFPEYRE
jgi:predicted N-acyltransferase